jgi:hypothetical protein
MAKKKKGPIRVKPGKSVTKKVKKGPNKGDTVQFRANSSSAKIPGKLTPRRVVKDVGKKNTSGVTKGKAISKRKPAKKKK